MPTYHSTTGGDNTEASGQEGSGGPLGARGGASSRRASGPAVRIVLKDPTLSTPYIARVRRKRSRAWCTRADPQGCQIRDAEHPAVTTGLGACSRSAIG